MLASCLRSWEIFMTNINTIIKNKWTDTYWSQSRCFSLGRSFFCQQTASFVAKKLYADIIPTCGASPCFAQWPWKSFSWPRSPFSTSEAALLYRPQPPGLVEKTNSSITQTPLGKFCATWEFSWTKVQSLVLLSLKIDVTLNASPHPPVPWRTRGPLNLWTAFLLGRDYMTIAKSLPSYWPQTWASVWVLLRTDRTQGFSGNLLPIKQPMGN